MPMESAHLLAKDHVRAELLQDGERSVTYFDPAHHIESAFDVRNWEAVLRIQYLIVRIRLHVQVSCCIKHEPTVRL